jgi:hypothetical protein
MTSGRDKTSTSSESQSEALRGSENESKLDLRSTNDLKATKLDRYQAKKLAQEIIKNGEFSFTGHCHDELQIDNMGTPDAVNVIRCGKIGREPEFSDKSKAWRYRIETQIMGVIVEIHSPNRLRVITGWRRKP